jgi:hypothetical protein
LTPNGQAAHSLNNAPRCGAFPFDFARSTPLQNGAGKLALSICIDLDFFHGLEVCNHILLT